MTPDQLQKVLRAAVNQLFSEIQQAQKQRKTRYDGLPVSPWAFVRSEQAARKAAEGFPEGEEAYERACALLRAIRDGAVHEWLNCKAETPDELVHQGLLYSVCVTSISEREFDPGELRDNAIDAADGSLNAQC
jgi:hypothetical protein